MVTYIRSDLDFILAQIKIAEEHSDFVAGVPGARPLFGVNGSIPANNISWGLRTVDGTYNNLIPGRTDWGSADQPFPTLLDPDYRPAPETLDMNGSAPGGVVGVGTYTPTPNSPGAIVVDSAPRTISNLIVDMSPNNPAAVEKALDVAGIEGQAKADAIAAIATAVETYKGGGTLADLQIAVAAEGLEMAGESLVMQNVAPDEGLSAPFNSWFTLFGQFFDHGLDLVAKGQSGTVFIPLKEDDPLYDPESNTNFMVLTRATVDEQGRALNTTTPFVDQNQTYTSHPSHQVFLREYVMTDDGPVATGKALDGVAGGLPTWGQIKAQAANMLGIDLDDVHVGNLPLLATDPYGNFIPDPATGFPQVVMLAGGLASGTPGTPLTLVTYGATAGDVTHLAERTGHAFLDDIAHTAVPAGLEDGDITIGLDNGEGAQTDGFYDNELLDAHFITGDGRGNENIGLTAVHMVFHAEHNRLVEHTKETVLAENDLAFLNEWLREDVDAVPTTAAGIAALQWDGERLFQAAKFGTEMQYQHLVFEEFARKIQPNIDVFLVPAGYDATVNPAIVAEFAHVVYRFGHSMLTETVDRFDANFTPDHISLIDGFLNPIEFLKDGTISAEEAAGSIVRGMTRQAGNEIDEFVTGALRNNLLGLPLDLATINLARGRDTGVPSLNEARREFYEVTGGNSELRPYDSWVDFADGLKNPASIVNFIAAYGDHPLLLAADTLDEKREAALILVGLQTPTQTVTDAAVISNQGFEANSLAAGPGVITDPLGNYTTTAPDGWTISGGQGGLIAPAAGVVDTGGVQGTNVAWLRQGATLSQDTGILLEQGKNYRLTLDVGDRADFPWPAGGVAQLVDGHGTVLASTTLTEPPDGGWAAVTVETGQITAAEAGSNLSIRIVHPDATGNQILIDNVRLDVQQTVDVDVADRFDFLNGTGAYAGTKGGLEHVDLWIGGLAEKNLPFGGMLGSTFNFVFEIQMEKLQNSDRFYYLQRLDGLHLFGEMENNSFAAMIMRNTDAIHLPSDVFSTPGLILEVNQSLQYNAGLGSADPVGGTILNPLVDRDNNATPGPDSNYLKYNGSEHVVLGGTANADILIGGIGDDTFHGDGGNDRIEGGAGNDIINGGAGDDIITDLGGDDNIKGGDGNDAINGGQGANLILGGAGKDFIVAGADGATEVFAGRGDDFILGSRTTERILGNEGNDWIEEGTFDGAPGDNFDEIFAGDMLIGHDVFLGDGSTDEFIGEGGDDIMVGSAGINKLEGMSGFDWATYKDNPEVLIDGSPVTGVWADLTLNAFDEFPLPPPLSALDQYGNVEGLSGSAFRDRLDGSEATAADIAVAGNNPNGSKLLVGHIGLIDGLEDLLVNDVLNDDGDFDAGDIILGGAGSDQITGRGGNDIIDGDKWLNVRISVRENADGTGVEIGSHDSMKTLVAQVFSGAINPGQLQIVREILSADGTGSTDVAHYRGNRDEYQIEFNLPGGGVRVRHVVPGAFDDGTDTLYNMEKVRFADGVEVFLNNQDPIGGPVISDTTPTQGFQLTADPSEIEDPNGTTDAVFTYQWYQRANPLLPWVAIAGATLATFTPTAAQINNELQVVATFTDDQGTVESVASAPTAITGANFNGTNANNTFNGTEGADFMLGNGGADTLNGNGGDDHLDGGAGNDLLNGGDGMDVLIGGANGGADRLLGGAGNDNLDGGGGSDILDGGTGADTMAGGAGNDDYFVDDVGDVVIELAGGGTQDDVFTTLNTYTLPDNVERLFFTGAGTFTGTGNALSNQMTGGALNDVLDGGSGNDQMTGLGGDDTYHVDNASDTTVEAVGGGIDTVLATVTDTMNANVENLILVDGAGNIGGTGNAGANTMTGNSGNNALNGGGGDDTMTGGEGNDILSGAAGNDTLNGGTGNDALNGGAGFDRFVFAPGFGNDTITGFDFNPAGGGQDVIDLTAYSMLASIVITDEGSFTRITVNDTDTIDLLGVGNAASVTIGADILI